LFHEAEILKIAIVISQNVYLSILYKKSLKIPKGQSESVNRRKTDSTMAKRVMIFSVLYRISGNNTRLTKITTKD
jgi:hypothetical protein